MGIAIAFAVALVLFFGFLALTKREARTGTRFLGGIRSSLDAKVHDLSAAVGHRDVWAVVAQFLMHAAHRVAHDVAHVTLAGVQALEAFLRRLVVRLRSHAPAHKGNPRAFVEHMNGVKKVLRAKPEETRTIAPVSVEETPVVAETTPEVE